MSNLPASYDDDMSRGADPGIDELPAELLEILGKLAGGAATNAEVRDYLFHQGTSLPVSASVTALLTGLYHRGFVSRSNPGGWRTTYSITAEGLTEVASMSEVEPGTACQYSATHKATRVPATVVISCGTAVGLVPACGECAAFYQRMGH